MRINKHVAIVLTFLASTMLFVCSVEGTGEAPDSCHMRCVVKITADAEVMPLDFDVVASLLQSDGVAGEAARDVLAGKGDWSDEFIEIRPLSGLRPPRQEDMPAAPPDGQVAQASTSVGQPAVLLSFSINLPDDVKPVARELGTAMVENLRRELDGAFNAQVEWLRLGLSLARTEQDTARAALSDVVKETMPKDVAEIRLDPADEAVYKQLDTVVDLSSLKAEMPLEEAVEMIRRSVNPPLQMVVLWRDLSENAQIEPSTPIITDGLTNAKLSAGLRSLLNGMSNPQFDIQLDYVVEGGVLTIGTDHSLPQRTMEMRVHEVPALLRATGWMHDLTATIQETITPHSWFSLSERGEGTIVPYGNAKLIVWQTPEVQKRIAEFLRAAAEKFPIPRLVDAPRDVLETQMQSLLAHRNILEEELDKLQARQGVLAQEKDNAERREMENSLRQTVNELSAIVTDLQGIRRRMASGNQDSPEVQILDAAIDKARRCIDACWRGLPRTEGGLDGGLGDMALPPWGFALSEAQTLSRRLTAKQGGLEQVSRRITRIQDALIGQTRFDPEVYRLHLAAKRLEEADLRVHHMEKTIAALQPCTVTILGDSD